MGKPSRKAGRADYARCRRCGNSRYDGHKISSRGLCEACVVAAITAHAEQMSARSGPIYRRQLEGQLARVLRELERTA